MAETKATFTPGPWLIEDSDKYRPKSTIMANGCVICHIPTIGLTLGEAADEDAANARLIASAPKLLEALQFFVASRSSGGGYAKFEAAEEVARTAIAKATRQEGGD